MTSIFSRLADALQSDWAVHARKEQLPPPGDWSVWCILSGRGWGKTRTGAEWVKSLIVSGQAPAGCVGWQHGGGCPRRHDRG
jgi:phage terminase large subunit-like protein